jgi:putative ABC transport system substrate-binding protein
VLLTDSVNRAGVARRAAASLASIPRAAPPGDLPIARPSNIDFVVHLKTAKALGFTSPQSLLLRADRVIE